MEKVKKYLFGGLLAAVLAFIWIHSAMPRAVSSEESTAVMGWLTPFLEVFFGAGNVTHNLVRKLAHLAEYGALGFLLYANLVLWKRKQPLRMVLRLGLYTAFLDETIQIFSGRGPQIQDVWLDLLGVALGMAVAMALRGVCSKMNTAAEIG